MSGAGQRVAFAALLALAATPTGAQVAELAKLAPASGAAQMHFGSSVAGAGERAVVGAPGKQDTPSAPGRAYVYERDASGAWIETALVPSDSVASDHFGHAVAQSGERVLIGAPAMGLAGPKPGAAYVFERDPSGAWSQRAVLMGSDTVQGDEFATAVALAGERAIVGAYHQATPEFMSGAAYVFERRSDGTWVEVHKLVHVGAGHHDYFGFEVALSGERALITATGDAQPGPGIGSAYVFERQAGGTWVQVAALSAADGAPTFGATASLSGERAVIGAYNDHEIGLTAGAAYVFERQVDGTWPQAAKLLASDGEPFDFFGTAVAIDGARAVVGALGDHDTAAQIATGSAYVFERTASGTWTEVAKLLAGDDPGTDSLGEAVALSGDRVLLGARRDDPAGVNSGSAYAFDLEPLDGAVDAISLASGGAQPFALEAGHLHASQPYLLLGSASGSSPGIDLGAGLILPLNPDAYFLFTLAHPNQPPLAGSFALLDAAGRGSASFSLPAGSDPALAGLEALHAFAVLALPSLSAAFASNAVATALLP